MCGRGVVGGVPGRIIFVRYPKRRESYPTRAHAALTYALTQSFYAHTRHVSALLRRCMHSSFNRQDHEAETQIR